MPTHLPYLQRPGSLKTALERIRTAATPERVTGDFVSGTLNLKGGTGAALIPYLKKVGFVAADGAPTEIYKTFRNQSRSGVAAAAAVKYGYAPLGQVNETFFKLADKDLKDLILQVTGAAADNTAAKLSLLTLKTLMSFADFKAVKADEAEGTAEEAKGQQSRSTQTEFVKLGADTGRGEQVSGVPGRVGLNLAYTINLNLPATTDQAVFNAIFKSLREHLLSPDD